VAPLRLIRAECMKRDSERRQGAERQPPVPTSAGTNVALGLLNVGFRIPAFHNHALLAANIINGGPQGKPGVAPWDFITTLPATNSAAFFRLREE
jgi:hypothetical protein